MNGVVWLNGLLQPLTSARIDPTDRGFLLGDGIFETIRVANGRAPLLDLHLDRLAEGARILRLSPPHRAELRHAVMLVMNANTLVDGALRLTQTRGPGPRGLLPPSEPTETTLIAAFPPAPPLPPAHLHISRQIRDGNNVLNRVKTLNYLPNVLARLEAQDAGADDALLCNPAGRIACGSAANFIVLAGGRLQTPALAEGALPGVGRRQLLASGLCSEDEIARELPRVEAAWLVNALSVRTVYAVGHHTLSCNKEWTSRLKEHVHPA